MTALTSLEVGLGTPSVVSVMAEANTVTVTCVVVCISSVVEWSSTVPMAGIAWLIASLPLARASTRGVCSNYSRTVPDPVPRVRKKTAV